MDSIFIGTVSEEEKVDIKKVHTKLLALENLEGTLNRTDLLIEDFEKLKHSLNIDLSNANQLEEKWWLKMIDKYKWDKTCKNQYRIYFDSNKVYKILN